MKFCRFGPRGQEKPGLVMADGTIRDLSGEVADITADALAGLVGLAEILKPGDTMRLGSTGLGEQAQQVIEWRDLGDTVLG